MNFLNVLSVLLVGLLVMVSAVQPGLVSVAQPGDLPINQNKTGSAVFNNTLSCTSLVSGLSSSDCGWLSSIGFAGQGSNPTSGNMFIGDSGPNKFVFTNNAGIDVVLVMWDDGSSPETSTAPYVSGYAPAISWSLSHGASVTVSVADTVSGGFAGVYVGSTGLDSVGQIYQTWGEFTTGPDATVDVSREVNMAGNSLSITTTNGCTSDMNDCVFECNGGGNNCWLCGSYTALNTGGTGCSVAVLPCDDPSMSYSTGGCQGWHDGQLTVTLS